MKNLIQSFSSTNAVQKKINAVKKQVKVVEKHSNQLERKCKKLLSDIDSAVAPFKLSKQFREIGLPIIEIVKNAMIADNKHDIKKMTILIANKIDDPFIDIMRDYGKGFDSTIVHNQMYFDSLGKISMHGLLVIKICPIDFGLKNNVEVTLAIY